MIKWGPGFYRVWASEGKPRDPRQPFPLQCPICGIHTDAEVIANFETPGSDFVRLPISEMKVYNYLVRCTRCKSGILVYWSYGEDYRRGGATAGIHVYPFPTSAFRTEQLPEKEIPAAIFEDLRQAELAYLADAYYGAGLLLRRACQNICREQKIPETGGLASQIKEMDTRGIITKHLADMADSIRIIGNELAHPDPNTPSVITPDDVRLAQEFFDQLVRAIYVDPARTKKLKEDLKKKGIK
ncbi:MAG: hypothetical protein A2Z15_06290 [Chloroflexi bacterium RBG_16_50_11]|nr:MAG: hypothetical protein A2Z15_06290 [Chloroflexi bacterium RBG_16_50_11]